MKKLIFFLLIFCLGIPLSYSQATNTEDSMQITIEEENADNDPGSTIEEKELPFKKPTIRIVSADSINNIRKQAAFEYMSYIDSFYKAKEPLIKKEEEPTEVDDAPRLFDNSGLRMLYWGLALLVVGWILWRLFVGRNALFARNKTMKGETEPTADIPLNDDHLNQLLNNAIQAKEYRLAVRYLYLQTLAALGEKQLLLLAPQKTNYQYAQELSDNRLKPAFSKLTMQYEYSWFGGFNLSSNQFDEIYEENKKFRESF